MSIYIVIGLFIVLTILIKSCILDLSIFDILSDAAFINYNC